VPFQNNESFQRILILRPSFHRQIPNAIALFRAVVRAGNSREGITANLAALLQSEWLLEPSLVADDSLKSAA
jgi:hypothetical protein